VASPGKEERMDEIIVLQGNEYIDIYRKLVALLRENMTRRELLVIHDFFDGGTTFDAASDALK
jgi:mannose/fructose-specific phosphotransferase system component IIA